MVAIIARALRETERRMSNMVIHEGAINRFFHNSAGPLGSLISLKTEEILAHAFNNAAPHFRSGDMQAGLNRTDFRQDADSIYKLVGTDAAHKWEGHEDFNYPIALELGGVTPSGSPYHYPFLGPAVEASGFRKEG